MALVGELLANDGFLPQLNALYNQKAGLFTRKNGVVFTALWFIFWVMMLPAFFAIADVEEGAAVSAVFGLFSTIMLLVVSLGFLKRSPKTYTVPMVELPHAPQSLYGNAGQQALPPQQSHPAQSYTAPQGSWRAPDTGDLAQTPGSVTDGTTRLLQHERDQ